MNVYWLEQTEVDVRSEDDWLHASELVRLRAMRVPKRRTDWRLGRWTAKLAFAAYLDLPAHSRFLMDMEIRPAETGAPELYFADKPADASISISHCGGRAICAIAASGIELGCDLERIEPRTDAFIADYFTDAEKAVIARTSAANNPRMLALLWSAKESALKVLQTGLRADTRSVMVNPGNILFSDDENWRPLDVRCDTGRAFKGWWQHDAAFIRTLVASTSTAAPILLTAADACVGGPGRI